MSRVSGETLLEKLFADAGIGEQTNCTIGEKEQQEKQRDFLAKSARAY